MSSTQKYRITLDMLRMAKRVRTILEQRREAVVGRQERFILLPLKTYLQGASKICHSTQFDLSLSLFRHETQQRLKKRQVNPCFPLYEKLLNAMEAADYSAQALNRYVTDLEACFEKYDAIDGKKGRSSTLYRLTKHLDRQKTPKK